MRIEIKRTKEITEIHEYPLHTMPQLKGFRAESITIDLKELSFALSAVEVTKLRDYLYHLQFILRTHNA